MKISLASPADIPNIMSLIKEAIAVMLKNGIDQWNNDYPSREIIAGDIAAGTLYKMTAEGKIAGIIVLNEWQVPQYEALKWEDAGGKYLVVHRLCLHPVFQGKGLSKKFMRFAENYAVKNQYTSLRLDTYSKNFIALNLYDSLGYRRAGDVSFRDGKTFHCFEKLLYTVKG